MFYLSQRGAVREGAVYGGTVAGGDFRQALHRHGTLERWALFTEPANVRAVQADLGDLQRAETSRIGTIQAAGYDALLERFDDFALTQWHDIDSDVIRLDVRRAFHLRQSRARALYPISITHHTFSYPYMLHEWFLPLLLADTQPCDSIVCTSQAAREAIRQLLRHVAEEFERAHGVRLEYRGRLDCLPLGVDTDLFKPRDKADVRRQYGLPQDAFLLLWMGRVSSRDKADLLPVLNVLQELVREHPGVRLLLGIAGTGPSRDASALQDHARALGLQEHVRLLGKIDPTQRHLLHAAADVFLSPVDNIQETFGLTPIEAMACGVPQVVTDWDGYRDTVSHGETGFLIPTCWAPCDEDLSSVAPITGLLDHLTLAQAVAMDLGALRTALSTLIQRPELRERMARSSRRRAVEQFGWRRVVAGYEALWSELGQVARGLPPPVRRTQYTHPPYCSAFAGYPSRMLEGDEVLRLTARGSSVLRGEEPLPLYHREAAPEPEAVQTALERLRAAGRRRGVRFSELVERLTQAHPGPLSRARRQVLWLLKYGFAELEAPRSTGRRPS